MSITLLPRSGYVTKPWKNGAGQTDEIYLLPADASRDTFDLRISSAPINERSAFSGFDGVDRAITLIEGSRLDLDFGSWTEMLKPLTPYSFDSTLAPIGSPGSENVRVINVMVNRRSGRLEKVRRITVEEQLSPDCGGLIAIFALAPAEIVLQDKERHTLFRFDTAVLKGEIAQLIPSAKGALIYEVSTKPAPR